MPADAIAGAVPASKQVIAMTMTTRGRRGRIIGDTSIGCVVGLRPDRAQELPDVVEEEVGQAVGKTG